MSKLKVGIIGCGGIAGNKHIPSLAACDDLAEITAFCDMRPGRAEKLAEENGGGQVYTDYRELLDKADVDVVHVLTPNVSHCPITVAALSAGKHVMCEKPMAHTAADARKMLDAWKKSGKKFTIGYQNRFRPEVQALHKSCRDGELGEIYYAKAHAVRRRAVPTWGVFPDKSQQGGGPLIDIGTHALDITLWMMGNYEPESVSGTVFYKLGNLPQATEGNMFGPWDPEKYEVEDSAMGFIRMRDGAAIHLEAAWALNVLDSREAAATLCGTKAGAEIRAGMSYPEDELIYNRGKNGLLVEEHLSPAGAVAYFEGAGSAAGVLEARQWLESILYDRQPLVRPEEALKVTEILEAIYRSAESGAEVRF